MKPVHKTNSHPKQRGSYKNDSLEDFIIKLNGFFLNYYSMHIIQAPYDLLL